jgi:membrane dipeptidase
MNLLAPAGHVEDTTRVATGSPGAGCILGLFWEVSLIARAEPPLETGAEDTLRARASALHRTALVFDTHSDTPTRLLDGRAPWARWSESFDVGKRNGDGHMDLPRMRDGGLSAQFFSVYVAREYAPSGAARRALDMIDAVYRMVEAHEETMALARSAGDIEQIAGGKKRIAALMGLEGGHGIENSLAVLRMFYALGVRYMTLTHTNTNDWCDSSTDEPRWHGLNDFGRKVVREMNRLGMIVDVSHISDEAFFDVLESSSAPVIASHSSCRALSDHPRNMTDEMISALARAGGVIHINFNAAFVNEEYRRKAEEWIAGERERIETRVGDPARRAVALRELDDLPPDIPPPPFSSLVDQIDHAVRLVGPEHVGLGSDFDGVPALPEGIEDCAKLPRITHELLRRGHKERDVLMILGRNTLRTMKAVEAVARRLRETPLEAS